jgi:hypothetical protein
MASPLGIWNPDGVCGFALRENSSPQRRQIQGPCRLCCARQRCRHGGRTRSPDSTRYRGVGIAPVAESEARRLTTRKDVLPQDAEV